MKHRGNLHAAQKGRVGLSLAILTAMAAMGMSGCSWDADLYKELVKAGDVNPCPPRILLDDHSDKYSCLVKVVYEEDGFDLVRCDEDGNDVDGGCEKNTKNQFLSIKRFLMMPKKTRTARLGSQILQHFMMRR